MGFLLCLGGYWINVGHQIEDRVTGHYIDLSLPGNVEPFCGSETAVDFQMNIGQNMEYIAFNKKDRKFYSTIKFFYLDRTGTYCSRHPGCCPIFQ